MTNPLREMLLQGAEVWNEWRRDNTQDIDLRGNNLRNANLSGADLSGVDLSSLPLPSAYVSDGDKPRTFNVNGRDYTLGINLAADLRGANLRGASLRRASLDSAILSNADLSYADLSYADLSKSDLHLANLSRAVCGRTIFGDVDLSTTQGLSDIEHHFHSLVSVDTLYRSKGKIPDIFLHGCGVPENLITYLPSLLESAIQLYSCFISYSHADKEFAKLLYDRLDREGIRCWLDEHQLNPGDKLHSTIYDAIRDYDKMILCCSKTSLISWWVEKEFENAVIKEEDYDETVLIPVDLDGYLLEQSTSGWVVGEIRKRHAQRFIDWKNPDEFEKGFQKVLNALRMDGGKPPPPEPKLKRKPKKC
jgi:uncharacterized protein YjbI with pentapeptide repeats